MVGIMQEEPEQLMLDSTRLVVGGGIDQEVTDSKISQLDERDRISNLPQDLINCILSRLQVHDAARTSILSKEWRCIWTLNPQLNLDKSFFLRLTSNIGEDGKESAFLRAVELIISVHIHQSLRLFLYIPPKVDQCHVARWIELYLKKGIQWIELDNSQNNAYEIPSCLFDCVKLICLELHTWTLNAPHKCTNFTNLLRVRLRNITFNADISFGTQLKYLSFEYCIGIQHLGYQFTNGNRLREVILFGREQIDWRWFECTQLLRFLALEFTSYSNFNPEKPINLIKYLSNLPRINRFHTNGFTLAVCRPALTMIKGRLTTKVKNLKELILRWLGSYNLCQISNTIYLIRCLPNLQRIWITLVDDKSLNPVALTSNLDFVDWKDMSLCRLHTVDIRGVVHSNYVSHLVKILLASSPSLKVMSLLWNSKVTDPTEVLKIRKEVQNFPRRSSAAKISWGCT